MTSGLANMRHLATWIVWVIQFNKHNIIGIENIIWQLYQCTKCLWAIIKYFYGSTQQSNISLCVMQFTSPTNLSFNRTVSVSYCLLITTPPPPPPRFRLCTHKCSPFMHVLKELCGPSVCWSWSALTDVYNKTLSPYRIFVSLEQSKFCKCRHTRHFYFHKC